MDWCLLRSEEKVQSFHPAGPALPMQGGYHHHCGKLGGTMLSRRPARLSGNPVNGHEISPFPDSR
jgi:hypothetical protein